MPDLSLKKRLYFSYLHDLRKRLWAHYFQLERDKTEKGIPKITLREKNISHLKTLTDRESLLRHLPTGVVVAEIGVDKGEFSELIIKYNSPKKLHLIDVWGDKDRYHDGLKDQVRNKFSSEINNGTIELNVGISTKVLPDLPDGYFDWVYLDTDHSYQTTKAELFILSSKVKKGGIIAGHDYTIGNWVSNYRYGVIEAVNEFCVNEDWEIIFLTSEADHHRSFAIRKLLPTVS